MGCFRHCRCYVTLCIDYFYDIKFFLVKVIVSLTQLCFIDNFKNSKILKVRSISYSSCMSTTVLLQLWSHHCLSCKIQTYKAICFWVSGQCKRENMADYELTFKTYAQSDTWHSQPFHWPVQITWPLLSQTEKGYIILPWKEAANVLKIIWSITRS